jgi:hypothetical protein
LKKKKKKKKKKIMKKKKKKKANTLESDRIAIINIDSPSSPPADVAAFSRRFSLFSLPAGDDPELAFNATGDACAALGDATSFFVTTAAAVAAAAGEDFGGGVATLVGFDGADIVYSQRMTTSTTLANRVFAPRVVAFVPARSYTSRRIKTLFKTAIVPEVRPLHKTRFFFFFFF